MIVLVFWDSFATRREPCSSLFVLEKSRISFKDPYLFVHLGFVATRRVTITLPISILKKNNIGGNKN